MPELESTIDYLPEMLREMAEAVGLPAVLRLVEWRGGVTIWVPLKAGPEHELVRRLGREAADWLIERFANGPLTIPKASIYVRAARDDEIRSRNDEGESVRLLALEYGLTERQVWRILADAPEDNRQAALF